MKYDQLLEINGQKLDKHYIQSLNKQERLELIEPIFQLVRSIGWLYPDNDSKIKKDYQRLKDLQVDISKNDLFNNSSLATNICKYFCRNFYLATERDKPTLIDNFNNDKVLKRLIENRLGLDWLDSDDKGHGVNEAFNLSMKMLVQGQRSMRLVTSTSIFKPDIAKYLSLKYSQEGETIFDYSIGWGARMMGAACCNRKYIGVDPLTVDEVQQMADYLELKNVRLIKGCSEDIRLEENSMDFSYSSPPYFDMEYYVQDSTQAYNKGEEYFYETYWRKTMENSRYMLKSGKYFGLNILGKFTKMIDITKEYFGEPVETVRLRTIKSHLGKNMKTGEEGITKFEPIFIFKNEK